MIAMSEPLRSGAPRHAARCGGLYSRCETKSVPGRDSYPKRTNLLLGGRASARPLFGRIELHPAPLQRLAEQAFDLGVDAPQIGRRRSLERGPQSRLDAQRER